MSERSIFVARFDEKLPLYLYLQSLGLLLVTVIGIPLIPIWLFAGWFWARRYYAALRCELTNRRLRIHRGVIFQQDKTIPLDKIQDLSLHHGPVLRALGLCSLKVETAGQSGAQGSSDADLIGIVDALAFQEMVLAQRDLLDARHLSEPAEPHAVGPVEEAPVLEEIRDTLRRIEVLMARERDLAQ